MEASEEQTDRSSSSGDDEDTDEDDTDTTQHVRTRREVGQPPHAKCECTTPCGGLHPWSSSGMHLSSAHSGNPVYGPRMQLYCRTGFHLAITADGKVCGSPDDYNKFAVMELSSVDISEVRIRGVETNLFLAMNKKGRLYGEEDMNADGTIFVEELAELYNTYTSKTWSDWLVGIGKHGKSKRGTKTKRGQKATQFLPRRVH